MNTYGLEKKQLNDDWLYAERQPVRYVSGKKYHSGAWAIRKEGYCFVDKARLCKPAERTVGSRSIEFDELAKRWIGDTKLTSSTQAIVIHPSYQRIIGMGTAAVPHILRRLQVTPEPWFWALQSITGENPVPAEDIGRMNKMRTAWLQWGKLRGYSW
jgi:hypothetical protein